ncbi:MAG: hypothetical protein JNL02_11250 [Saprospiraceae bacterium]|nr:hypothetical protein [Saprospiraceae bacterium]
MKFIRYSAGLLLVIVLSSSFHTPSFLHPDWGFFAHRRINRLAVFTLPPEMMVFFKPHIDWLADHATDADMRRYASPNEAPRHFIDLDQYGPPFDHLPQSRYAALVLFTDVGFVDANGDTAYIAQHSKPVSEELHRAYDRFFFNNVLPRLGAEDQSLNVDSINLFFNRNGLNLSAQSAFFREHLGEHGLLPWHLQKMERDLTEAFRRKDSRRILRLCADMGHYIGDAHVPLHTTSNYNGQKTGQTGIHGFWESRIPELFADDQYDYFVGKAEYIEHTTDYFWGVVFTSNSMVDSVLTLERALRLSFPPDRQMCPDLRNGLSVITPCRDFAAAYQDLMQGMVERRMRAAIHSVASVWYTAWVDAGQPDLSDLPNALPSKEELEEDAELRRKFQAGAMQGRVEEH